jgi:hypothetical protein
MKSIEIIVHAYAISYSHYAALLAYQLSSLVIYPPKCKVRITICRVLEDEKVQKTIDYFYKNETLDINSFLLTKKEIGRRSIGRNKAALESTGDIIWFADVDYFFGENCLDFLSEMDWPKNASIIFPRRNKITRYHGLGDEIINRMIGRPRTLDIDKGEFKKFSQKKAIGGLQIVKGEFARKYGYCRRRAWQMPLDPPFSNTREDVVYRKFCETQGVMVGITLPQLFRIRHTTSALETHIVVR